MKDLLTTILRVSLGAVFLYLGWNKTQDPVTFLKTIREFQILEQPLLMNMVAAWLPWFEVWCGFLLVLGVGVRTAACTVGTLLFAFTSMILWRALQIHALGDLSFCAIRFDCGCGSGEVLVCLKLLQNSFLIVLSFGLAQVKRHAYALWPQVCP